MVSALEALALTYPIALFLNGSVGLGVKYMQWKNKHLSETLYTFVGVILGIFGIASAVSMFHFEYGDLPSRVILLVSGVHMMTRPLRHKRWAAILSLGVGAGVFYGAAKYWGGSLEFIRQVWLDFFNTTLFLETWQIALLGGLGFGLLMYPVFKFAEDLLGTASNFLDNPFIAVPIGVLSVIEGIATGIPPHHSIITYALVFLVGSGAASTLNNSTGGLLIAPPKIP